MFRLLCWVAFPFLLHGGQPRPATSHNICPSLRRGHFAHRYKDVQHPAGAFNFHIYRDDSTQLEVNEISGDTSSYRISWIDTCHYELLLTTTTLRLPDSVIRLRRSWPLHTVITGNGPGYYIYNAYRSNVAEIITDTVWIQHP